jgi:uracil-DNA glycosylase family 4
MSTDHDDAGKLAEIAEQVVVCRRCPRLRDYDAEVARVKRRAFRDEEYWGKPVPGFGDPRAQLLVVGLAPAAHGGNRTGRMFTGDLSGDFLYSTLARYGFANQPTSISRQDGLQLIGAYVTAAGRCAPPQNRPIRQELDNCRPFLAREMAALPSLRVVIALGAIAWQAVLRVWADAGYRLPSPRPKFAHASEVRVEPDLPLLIGSYHPSQRNTQTGLLTRPMFHTVFSRARRILL